MRDAIYKSEFAAEKTNIRIAALSIAGSAGIPLMMIATTNGEAAAVVLALLASINFGEL